MNCPCCSQRAFAACCQPFLNGIQTPNTPEQLMRSRYSAFATNKVDYIIATQIHDNTAENKKALEESLTQSQWLGLIVLTSGIDKTNKHQGKVEFAAFYRDNHNEPNSYQQLHENSRFIHKDNRWFYTTGDILDGVKLGRNDTCFCGSNKKFKRCHG